MDTHMRSRHDELVINQIVQTCHRLHFVNTVFSTIRFLREFQYYQRQSFYKNNKRGG